MTIEIVLDYFKPITSHQPGAVLSVHEIATGSLITESQSNTGALVAMSV